MSKRSCNVFNSLPYDCWCEIIRFIESKKDFLSIILTVKGLFRHVQILHSKCAENVVHFIRGIPKSPQPQVSLLRFTCPKSSSVQRERRNFLDFTPSKKDDIIVDHLEKYLKSSSESFGEGVTNFETLFSRLLSPNMIFRNVERLEIEILETGYEKDCTELDHEEHDNDLFLIDIYENFYNSFVDPMRNLAIESINSTSQLHHLKHLEISLTCGVLKIKRTFPFVITLRLLRLGVLDASYSQDDILDDDIEDYTLKSFKSKEKLNVKWAVVFPSLINLHLHNWFLEYSQICTISSQIEKLWLDYVEIISFDVFTENYEKNIKLSSSSFNWKKLHSLKLSGEVSSIFESSGKFESLGTLIFENCSQLTTYFNTSQLEYYHDESRSSVISFSSFKDHPTIRKIKILCKGEGSFVLEDEKFLFENLPNLELFEFENFRENLLSFSNCQKLEEIICLRRFYKNDVDVINTIYSIGVISINGDFPRLKTLHVKNSYFNSSSITSLRNNDFNELVKLSIGFDRRRRATDDVLEDDNVIKDDDLETLELLIRGFNSLSKLWIGYLGPNRSVSGVMECPGLEIACIRERLSTKFRILKVPSLYDLTFSEFSFSNFVQERKKKKISDYLSKKAWDRYSFHPNFEKFVLSDLKNMELQRLAFPISPFDPKDPEGHSTLRYLKIGTTENSVFLIDRKDDEWKPNLFFDEEVALGGNFKVKSFCCGNLEYLEIIQKKSVIVSSLRTLVDLSITSVQNCISIKNCRNLLQLIVTDYKKMLSIEEKDCLPNLEYVGLKNVKDVWIDQLDNLEELKWIDNDDEFGFFDITVKNCRNLREIKLIAYPNGTRKVESSGTFQKRIILDELPSLQKLSVSSLTQYMDKHDTFELSNVSVRTLSLDMKCTESVIPKDRLKITLSEENVPELRSIHLHGVKMSTVCFYKLQNLKKLDSIVIKDTPELVKFVTDVGKGINLDTVRVVMGKKGIITLQEYLQRIRRTETEMEKSTKFFSMNY